MKIKYLQTIIVGFIFILSAALPSYAFNTTMKIVVASTGEAKNAAISQQMGRALFFLFFDEKGNLLEAAENPARGLSGGVSQSVSSFLTSKGVTHIIAGDIGNKMKQALKNSNIQYIQKTGTVSAAVQELIQSPKEEIQM